MNPSVITFSGLGTHLGNLARLSNARTRSLSPENFDGGKGRGGMLENGKPVGRPGDSGSSMVCTRSNSEFVQIWRGQAGDL